MRKGLPPAYGLTVVNAALVASALLLIALRLAGTDVSGASWLDVPAALLSWAWILLTPVTAIAGVVLARRARSGRLVVVNAVVLGLWVLSTAYLMTLTR